MVGIGFVAHGYAKLSRGPAAFAAILQAIGVPAPDAAAWLTILVEVCGGLAVMLGAFVRFVSVPMAAVLVVAMLTVHLPYGFSSVKLVAVTAAGAQFGPPGYEIDLLYLVCLAALVLSGPGPFAIDRLIAVRGDRSGRSASTPAYRIRQARPGELQRLREIEDDAGRLFSGLGLVDEARDQSFPLDDLARLVRLGQVWVACPEDDVPVGMVIASVREGAVHIEEMDVLPEHGRRGLGGRLLDCACAWAQAQGYATVTLSTFRDVPWNGPFYGKHGFRELEPAEWTPGMRALREQEARHGLRVEARVFMRREPRR